VVDVRPKLLEDVEDAVKGDLRQPFLPGFGPRAFPCGVIKIGDAGSRPVPDNFGEIEASAARIGSRNDETTYRIAGPAEEPSVAQGVVARVLARSGWYDGFRKVVSDRLITERVSIVAAVSRGPLTEFGCRIFRLGAAGQHARNNKRGIIKAVLRGEPKLILERQGRKLRIGADRAIVWDNPKDALGLLTLRIVLWQNGRCRSDVGGLRLCRGFVLLC